VKEEKKSNVGNVILGVVLILFGALFLLGQFLDINLGAIAWPFFIIVPGVAVYLASLAMAGEEGKGFSAFGSIVTMVGLVLLFQNIFDRFDTWAYAWALVAPTSLGLGWIGRGLVRRNRALMSEGVRVASVGLGMFLVAATFFELVINIGGNRPDWAANLWPVLLILLGLFFLVRNLFGSRG
jgi:uncharacterized membrane protein HdeD (DUF308 family)